MAPFSTQQATLQSFRLLSLQISLISSISKEEENGKRPLCFFLVVTMKFTKRGIFGAALAFSSMMHLSAAFTQQQCALCQLIFMSRFSKRIVGLSFPASHSPAGTINFVKVGTAQPANPLTADCLMTVPLHTAFKRTGGALDTGTRVYLYGVRVTDGTAGNYQARTCWVLEPLWHGSSAPMGGSVDIFTMLYVLSSHLIQQLGQLGDYPRFSINARRRTSRGTADFNATMAAWKEAVPDIEDIKKSILLMAI